MRKLSVFNNLTLDGYFTDKNGDMSWAHKNDEEFNSFVQQNAKTGGELLFGRVTYEMMASYWPTAMAQESMPLVAEKMNSLPKIVFSKTLAKAVWNNTQILSGNLASEVLRLKKKPGRDMVIFGSGTIVSQLAQADLIDQYQFVLHPIAIGAGRTLFDGLTRRLSLKLTRQRIFANGSVFLCYERIE